MVTFCLWIVLIGWKSGPDNPLQPVVSTVYPSPTNRSYSKEIVLTGNQNLFSLGIVNLGECFLSVQVFLNVSFFRFKSLFGSWWSKPRPNYPFYLSCYRDCSVWMRSKIWQMGIGFDLFHRIPTSQLKLGDRDYRPLDIFGTKCDSPAWLGSA